MTKLDQLSGNREPKFWPIDNGTPGPRITAIGYSDLPEPGLLTGITYGLSLSRQPAWRKGRPELSICVRSTDPAWVLAIAHLASHLREACPFSYGNVINFGEPIAADTAMDGFVVFAPLMLDPSDARVDVGDDLPVILTGMYPTYASEREFISEHGLEAFWRREWDPYDVSRPPIV